VDSVRTLSPQLRGEGGERPQARSRASSTRYGREPREGARGPLINKDLRRETLPLTPTLSPLRGEREQTEVGAR